MPKYFILLLFLISAVSYAQDETDIVPYLKAIEEGRRDEVAEKLPGLIKQKPEDPSIIFLKAVLTQDADEALLHYKDIHQKYPRSRYADASVYRIYSYYFALGSYNTANKYLEVLKTSYPGSPYIKTAERNIPPNDEPVNVPLPETAASDKEPEEKESKTEYRFTIQAGAFSNKKNSSALVQEFRAAGFETEIKEKLVGGTAFEVVYVGKFVNEKDALEFLKRLNDRYNLDGRIVENKNGN